MVLDNYETCHISQPALTVANFDELSDVPESSIVGSGKKAERAVYKDSILAFLPSVLGKWKARGLEQLIFQKLVLQHGRDKVANAQNPVGPNNANRDNYMKEAGGKYEHQSK